MDLERESIYQTLLINCTVHVYNIQSMNYLVTLYKNILMKEDSLTNKDVKLIHKICRQLNIDQKIKDELFSLIK